MRALNTSYSFKELIWQSLLLNPLRSLGMKKKKPHVALPMPVF